MRSSLSCHLKSISVLLIVVFIFATLPVCRVAALETASISEYAKPYVEELTESIPFDYDDYTKPIKRDEFARLIYFAIKLQKLFSMMLRRLFPIQTMFLWERCPMPEL